MSERLLENYVHFTHTGKPLNYTDTVVGLA